MRAKPVVRIAVLALAALLAAGTLSACRTNVGAAATVNGTRISENDVTTYLSGKAPSAQLVQQAKSAGQELIAARVLVLQFEIQQRLYEQTLRRNGGLPSASTLAGVRNAAVSLLIGNGQSISDAQLRTQLGSLGVASSFVPRLLRATELEYTVVRRLQLSARAQLGPAVRKAGGTVTVSPRYGTWDATELSLNSTGTAGLPAYLRLQSASPSASAQPGAATAP